MPLYEASSRRRKDTDGLISVYCRECHQFITKTYVRMDNRAVCALCQRVLDGLPLTAKAIEEYEKNKLAQQDVSLVNMSKYDKPPDGTFKLRTMGGNILRALGMAKPPAPELESTKVAKAKKKPRIFADTSPSVEPKLGSILDLDKELERQKQKGGLG